MLITAVLLAGCSDGLGDRYVGFAKCLTEKNTTMYGAYWCPHCQNQKRVFGKEAFKSIHYVECDENGYQGNPQLCAEKGVKRFPTWEFGDGSKVEGELTPEQLAEKTKCELPKEGEDASAESPTTGTSSPS